MAEVYCRHRVKTEDIGFRCDVCGVKWLDGDVPPKVVIGEFDSPHDR